MAQEQRKPPTEPDGPRLTPELIEHARALHSLYAQGLFPMAAQGSSDESQRSPGGLADAVEWYLADPRAILPLTPEDGLHVPRRLQRTIRQQRYRITTDRAFDEVVLMCADPRRPGGWINDEVRLIAALLHRAGHAHSIEAWDTSGRLVGGVYGVAVQGLRGPVFCAESMATDTQHGRDAGKVCVVTLAQHLARLGYQVCDVQMATDHTQQFGVREITHGQYEAHLDASAGGRACPWGPVALLGVPMPG